MDTKSKLSKDIFWNTAGSLIYAMASMVLAFFVMHVNGPEDGGIFGFGFSTFGQQMFIIAYFGIRPFQITDTRGVYSFRDYMGLRRLTTLAAVLCALLYLGFLALTGRYTGYKALAIGLLALYKIMDGYGDVYESECQREGKLYLTGQLLTARTLLCTCGFMAALVLTGDLLLASLGAVLLQLISLLAYGRILPGALPGLAAAGGGGLLRLGRSTLLLFVSVFLDFYVLAAAKYAVDLRLTDADNGIFNILFMPTNIIYLVANFIIRPFMTSLSQAYEEGALDRFRRLIRNLFLLIAGLMAAACLLTLLLGGPVLSLGELVLGTGYRGQLRNYRAAFFWIIFGGGLYAMANLFYYMLVIMRRQKAVFAVYAAAAAAAFLISPAFAAAGGILGAALCYCLLMLFLLAGFFLLGRHYLKEEKKG